MDTASTRAPFITKDLKLFNVHALVKAQSQENITKTQIRLIIKPILRNLQTIFSTKAEIEQQLKDILSSLEEKFSNSPGYGIENFNNILKHLE